MYRSRKRLRGIQDPPAPDANGRYSPDVEVIKRLATMVMLVCMLALPAYAGIQDGPDGVDPTGNRTKASTTPPRTATPVDPLGGITLTVVSPDVQQPQTGTPLCSDSEMSVCVDRCTARSNGRPLEGVWCGREIHYWGWPPGSMSFDLVCKCKFPSKERLAVITDDIEPFNKPK